MNNLTEQLNTLDNIMIKYLSALKVLETQLQIINDDFKYLKKYNPIEHIKTRIKDSDSIIKKLSDDNLDFTLENIEKYINDIVGVRIVCAFKEDIYELIDIIRKSKTIHIIKEKNFLDNPKVSGYRSYHLIVEVPVELINGEELVKAEIQIRTMAQDLWASLDHKLRYKNEYCSDDIRKKLFSISEELNNIDDEMNNLLNIENNIKLIEGD